jgi:hypothetical protein
LLSTVLCRVVVHIPEIQSVLSDQPVEAARPKQAGGSHDRLVLAQLLGLGLVRDHTRAPFLAGLRRGSRGERHAAEG